MSVDVAVASSTNHGANLWRPSKEERRIRSGVCQNSRTNVNMLRTWCSALQSKISGLPKKH